MFKIGNIEMYKARIKNIIDFFNGIRSINGIKVEVNWLKYVGIVQTISFIKLVKLVDMVFLDSSSGQITIAPKSKSFAEETEVKDINKINFNMKTFTIDHFINSK